MTPRYAYSAALALICFALMLFVISPAWSGTAGTVKLNGSTSGTATITPQAAAGTPTLTLPNASGTFAVNASSPLSLDAVAGNLTLGTVGVGSGGTGTATTFTQGSVVFAGSSGVYSQDNSQFFWNDTTHRFGLGTATPTYDLSFGGTAGREIWLERAASGAGNNLTVSAGGAQSGATDKAGGSLILSSGISTGTGWSNIQLQTYPAAASTNTTDNTPVTALKVYASGSASSGQGTLATTLKATNGSGTDKNGGNLILSSGTSTGTGSSNINFNVYGSSGSSGSTANSATTAMTMQNWVYHGPQVSIGTTSFQDSLYVYGNASGTGNGHVVVQNVNSSGGGYGAVVVEGDSWPAFTLGQASSGYNSNSGEPAYSAFAESQTALELVADGTGGVITGIRFLTGGAASSNERMRIDNSGNVGISTTSPQSLLHVNGGEVQIGSSGASCASNNAGALRYSGGTLYYCNGSAWTSSGSGGTAGAAGSDKQIQFNASNSFSADSNFNWDYTNHRLGIGTAAPVSALTIGTNASSPTLTDYTQSLTRAGIDISAFSTGTGEYQPGLFWSRPDDNPTKPKAGIWTYMNDCCGSTMLFGVSDLYASGITREAMGINFQGNITIPADLSESRAVPLYVKKDGYSITGSLYGVADFSSSARQGVIIGNDTGTGGGIILADMNTNSDVRPLEFWVPNGSGYVERMIINGSGPVNVNAALLLSGTDTDSFVTPLGVPVPTKINVPLFDPGAYGQVLAMGLPSTAQATARVFSLLDARTVAHQPTLGVFSPDENNLAGFSWEGSNSTAYLKSTGGNIAVRSNSTDIMTLTSSGNVGIGSTSPNTNLDLGRGFFEWGGESRVSSDFSVTSSTTLSAITGLSSTLVAGKTYAFDIKLYLTDAAAGGVDVDLNGGTATATSLIGEAYLMDATTVKTSTRTSALNTALCNSTTTSTTDITCHITGTITVNAGGTFIPEFAQNASNSTASTVKAGSIMILHQIN